MSHLYRWLLYISKLRSSLLVCVCLARLVWQLGPLCRTALVRALGNCLALPDGKSASEYCLSAGSGKWKVERSYVSAQAHVFMLQHGHHLGSAVKRCFVIDITKPACVSECVCAFVCAGRQTDVMKHSRWMGSSLCSPLPGNLQPFFSIVSKANSPVSLAWLYDHQWKVKRKTSDQAIG